jgi:tetratricopeptide (TPR) repeat protein
LALFLLLVSCSKSLSPYGGTKISKQEAEARYDYYYVEGIRNKLTGTLSTAVSLFEECIRIAPERDGAYYQIGQIAYATGNYENAKKYAVNALKLSRNLWYYMLVANIYYQTGIIDSAILVYEEAEVIFPENNDIKYALGNFYFEAGQFEDAVRVYKFLDDKYGMSGSSAIPLIQSMIKLGKIQEAEEKLLLMIEIFPDDNTYGGLLAELYRDQGDLEKAAEVYNRLVVGTPDDPRVLSSLMDFYRKGSNYRELFGLLNSVAFNSQLTPEEKISIFAILLDDKEIIENYGNEYEMSLLVLEASHPESPIIHLLKPELYQLTGRQKDAMVNLETFIMKWPDIYYAYEKLLLLYLGAKDWEKMYAVSSSAVRKFNTAILPRLLNAAAAVEIGFYDEALEQLKKVRMLSNDNKELIIQILATEADAYYRKGEAEQAFKKFSEALELAPNDNLVLNNYAYFLAEKNTRLKDAQKMIEVVILSEPDNNTYLDTQAWVYFKQRKYRKAEAVMLRILGTEDNSDATYYEHYGYILKSMKRCEEAIIFWNKALEIDDSKENLKEEIEKCINRR